MNTTPDTTTWLFYGYTAIWFVMAFYIWKLTTRLNQIEHRLENQEPKQ